METYRLVLYIALAFVVMLMFQAWEKDYGNQPDPVVASQPANGAKQPADVPQAVPDVEPGTAPIDTPVMTSLPSSQKVTVDTDLYKIVIDTAGGDIREAKLKNYNVAVDDPQDKFTLLTEDPANLFITQSGLLGDNVPNHKESIYTSAATSYQMQEGKDKLEVVLSWQGKDNVVIDKVYTFTRDSYVIDINYKINNAGTQAWEGRMYRQFKRVAVQTGSAFVVASFTGAVLSHPDKPYNKISFDDIDEEPLRETITGGWTAMIQHYFFSAWLTKEDERSQVYSKRSDGNNYIIGMIAPTVKVAAGDQGQTGGSLFVGPKLQNVIETIAPNLELTVDYGVLTIISKPLFWLLDVIHDFVQNWGWSIIILTLLIKLAFYKLSEAGYRSMANMRKLQPRMVKMKERFGDDKQGMQRAMMDLYKKEKINPLGGCFPILVQIPVFIALYWVLLESVELRQADFIFWLNDLSSQDPYYVLPILMGISMWIQQKLNPAPLDPMQAKIMMMLPIIFTVFFLFFPSGLVLYWVTNNVLSIAQQWVITKRIESGEKA